MRAFAPLALGLVLLAVPAAAQVRTAPNNAREPIEIAADALEVQQDKRTATFNGNVNATQGTMVMRADRLVVTYTQGDRKSTRLNSSHTDISRMPSSA